MKPSACAPPPTRLHGRWKGHGSHGVVTEVCTIHRLLGVRQVRDENTGEEYHPDKNNPPTLDAGVQVVILDETSMLNSGFTSCRWMPLPLADRHLRG